MEEDSPEEDLAAAVGAAGKPEKHVSPIESADGWGGRMTESILEGWLGKC